MYCRLILFWLFTALFLSLRAQTPVFKNFTINDGLPSNEIYNLYEDKKGFIWICTDAGLVKYDANTFRVFSSNDGLPDNTVFEAKEDKQGRVWFRTFSGKVGYILNDTVHAIAASDSIVAFQKGGIICSFYIDAKGNLILGRQSAAPCSFLKVSPPYTSADISYVYPHRHDQSSWIDVVLLENTGYVYTESRAKRAIKSYRIALYNEQGKLLAKDSLADASNFTRMYRRKNRFAVAGSYFIHEFDLDAGSVKKLKAEDIVINVFINRSGDLIAGCRNRGVECLTGNEAAYKVRLLNEMTNSAILEDRNGGIWYSTLSHGIFYSGNVNYTVFDVPARERRHIAYLKACDEQSFVVGMELGQAMLYKLQNGRVKLEAELSVAGTDDREVKNYLELRPHAALISSIYSTYLYDSYSKRKIPLVNSELKNFTFPQSYLYGADLVGSGFPYVYLFDTVKFEIKCKTKISDRITSFAFDPDNGDAWLGAVGGLYHYYAQNELQEKDKVCSFRVKDLAFHKKRLFVASKDHGLVILSGSTIDTINANNGLLSNVCEKILIDGDNCWVSSNLGLSRINYHRYKNYEIVNYSVKNFGAPSVIRDFFIRDSMLYFASGSGIYTYPLRERRDRVPTFYVYGLEAGGVFIHDKKQVELDYRQATVKVRFAALYYEAKGAVRYRYKLLPGDRSWNYTVDNSILFPNLSSGFYTLLIEAQKNDGSWMRCRDEVSFVIQKPYWREWWFIALMVLAGSILIWSVTYFLYRKKADRERANNRLKLRLYNLEIKSMKAQMNPHFIFNALNSIQRFILANDNENAYIYLSKFSKLVRMLLESNSKENLAVETEIEILEKYLEIESLRFKDTFVYSLEIAPEVPLSRKIPHMMIQPFVENAIWHGLLPADGKRWLKVSFYLQSEDILLCTVEDNGVGIKNAGANLNTVQSRSMAMELIRERLALFSGTQGSKYRFEVTDISETNPKARGTHIRIWLPLFRE
jgi:ligand-binding sensor domain-containing protein